MDTATLTVFVPTFTLVSLTPGMCMTLALSLGIAVGLRRTLWMMAGELAGVAIGALAVGLGLATLVLAHPTLFTVFKLGGGAYLAYLGIGMWRDGGELKASGARARPRLSPRALAAQGFITAVANPKGWAFFIALLPPFIDGARPLAPQLAMLIGLIVTIEFAALLLYAGGGHGLRRTLAEPRYVRWLNRTAGSLLIAVGLWLGFG